MNKIRLGIEGILCLLIGFAVTLLMEAGLVFAERQMPMLLFPLLTVGISGILFFTAVRSWKRMLVVLVSISGCVLLTAALLLGGQGQFRDGSAYRNADRDAGVKCFFAGQKIMLIVPHQDDDLNVLGGTIEEFVDYGSEVYVVYLTNGDMTSAQTRYTEAIASLAKQGIPEENVIFLGYGDQWQENGPHLYNADPGMVLQSKAGYFATYGTAEHPPYHDGVPYTRENLLADMESVILEYRPDVIFCSDYDEHVDHKATSLVFEKVMGRILKTHRDYHPRVFKGFAYRTAWNNVFDYYTLNLKSTPNEYEGYFEPQVDYYRWEDRVRLPVEASGISRSLLGSERYDVLNTYVSQNAYQKAQGMLNADKVFWERSTASLCNGAQIQVSSGEADLLNDFMLLENDNLADKDWLPYDGVWIPETGDTEKKLTVILPEASDLTGIVLYDHPSPDHNILEAVITFDNGEQVTAGPLDVIGAATRIAVNQKQVASFEVKLTVTEGEEAGLTEVEAFADSQTNPKGFVQLTDADGEFVYDYITASSGELVLKLYHYGNVPEFQADHYTVTGDNESCSVVWSEEGIAVSCPPGEAVTVSVTSEEEGIWDRAYIRNPGKLDRARIRACQLVELFGLEVPENGEKDRLLQQFVLRRFQTKLWNFYYRLTH